MEKTILAVDLGGTKILVGEVTKTGEIIKNKKYISNTNSQSEALEAILSAIDDYLRMRQEGCQIVGIGIAVVGRVNSELGVWEEIQPSKSNALCLSDIVTEKYGLPCFISNDVTSAAFAEKKIGKGKNFNNFIYINFGTGIGARIISNNKIITGANSNAGEVGHMVIDYDSSEKCSCGNYGCVELLASGAGIHNQVTKKMQDFPLSLLYKKGRKEKISIEEMIIAYNSGDELASFVLDQAVQAGASFINNLIRVSDPQIVVCGGGVASEPWFIKQLNQQVNPNTVRLLEQPISVTEISPHTISFQGIALFAWENINGGVNNGTETSART